MMAAIIGMMIDCHITFKARYKIKYDLLKYRKLRILVNFNVCIS